MKLSSIATKALAASLILASTTGLAFAKNYKGDYKGEVAPCPPPVLLHDGWYVGIQGGYDSYRVRQGFSDSFVLPNGTTGTTTFNPSIAPTGWVGGLFLGYGQYLTDLFYLGGEVLGNYSGAQTSYNIATSITTPAGVTSTASASNTFRVRGSWGVALLPGIRLNDTSLGYIRLGWNWAYMRSSSNVIANGMTVASGSNNRTVNGFDFGLGIETLVFQNWSVRTEYNHAYYNSFNGGGFSNNPSDNQFMLGILYHFA